MMDSLTAIDNGKVNDLSSSSGQHLFKFSNNQQSKLLTNGQQQTFNHNHNSINQSFDTQFHAETITTNQHQIDNNNHLIGYNFAVNLSSSRNDWYNNHHYDQQQQQQQGIAANEISKLHDNNRPITSDSGLYSINHLDQYISTSNYNEASSANNNMNASSYYHNSDNHHHHYNSDNFTYSNLTNRQQSGGNNFSHQQHCNYSQYKRNTSWNSPNNLQAGGVGMESSITSQQQYNNNGYCASYYNDTNNYSTHHHHHQKHENQQQQENIQDRLNYYHQQNTPGIKSEYTLHSDDHTSQHYNEMNFRSLNHSNEPITNNQVVNNFQHDLSTINNNDNVTRPAYYGNNTFNVYRFSNQNINNNNNKWNSQGLESTNQLPPSVMHDNIEKGNWLRSFTCSSGNNITVNSEQHQITSMVTTNGTFTTTNTKSINNNKPLSLEHVKQDHQSKLNCLSKQVLLDSAGSTSNRKNKCNPIIESEVSSNTSSTVSSNSNDETQKRPLICTILQKTNQCNVCGRLYARPSTLKTHQRTHTNERPFKCNICSKTFSQAANLTAHQRVHTGELLVKKHLN